MIADEAPSRPDCGLAGKPAGRRRMPREPLTGGGDDDGLLAARGGPEDPTGANSGSAVGSGSGGENGERVSAVEGEPRLEARDRKCDEMRDREEAPRTVVEGHAKTDGSHARTQATAPAGAVEDAGHTAKTCEKENEGDAKCVEREPSVQAPLQVHSETQDSPCLDSRPDSSAGHTRASGPRWGDMSMTDDEDEDGLTDASALGSLEEPVRPAGSMVNAQRSAQRGGPKREPDSLRQAQPSHRIVESRPNVIEAVIWPGSRRWPKAQSGGQQDKGAAKGGSANVCKPGSEKGFPLRSRGGADYKSEVVDSRRGSVSGWQEGRPGRHRRSVSADQGLFQHSSRGRSSTPGGHEGPGRNRDDRQSRADSRSAERLLSSVTSVSDSKGRTWVCVNGTASKSGANSPMSRQARKSDEGGRAEQGSGQVFGQRGCSSDRGHHRSTATGDVTGQGRQAGGCPGHRRTGSSGSASSWLGRSHEDSWQGGHSHWDDSHGNSLSKFMGKMRMDRMPERGSLSQRSDDRGSIRLRRQRGSEWGRAGPERAPSSQSVHSVVRPGSSQSSRTGRWSPPSVGPPRSSGRGWAKQRPFDSNRGSSSQRDSQDSHRGGWPSLASQGCTESAGSAQPREDQRPPTFTQGGRPRHRRHYSEGAEVTLVFGTMSQREHDPARPTTLRRVAPEFHPFKSPQPEDVGVLNPDAKPFVPLQGDAK
ncbi:unnamed protein product [Ostreobium quekettii]|uniref:Uncharacterized protein n=1 Tax=Ostreobium quekettii TaxID=121088 RepID=A0A8S1J3S4_9CHLO|nr:unnamed protein product [Ostreobium quekettii]|eukprot:evm.model.scf_758.4 EVM.evm.TU.scf_758.4   scf_758:4550-7314(+)